MTTEPSAGVLLCNLGTPDAPTPTAVRRYLAEFLWDPRIVEIPRLLWGPILYGFVLPFRPHRVARAYASIWTEHGSPLRVISECQADALQRLFGDGVKVALGMRYGTPAIAAALRELAGGGVTRILVLPAYPQNSGTTIGSVYDAIAAELKHWRKLPEMRFVNGYHDDAGWLDALAASVREYWRAHGRGERLLMSFHGVPRRIVRAGDPYHDECRRSARLLAERLGLGDGEWQLSFQSLFGREEWLQPYTGETLAAWGRDGTGRVDVVCPGFSADCLETLEEIAIRYRELFAKSGGGELRYIPCLNDREDHIDALHAIAARHMRDWLD